MSPHRKALQSAESETTTTHLPESFQKTLKATANLFNALLNDDVVRIWKDLLNYCSEAEAVRALKKWQYESAYFPKPADILQLVANERDAKQIEEIGCSKECQKRHWTGYNENDIRWMFKKRFQEQGKRWNQDQWAALLDELDSKRTGGAPLWRQQEQ